MQPCVSPSSKKRGFSGSPNGAHHHNSRHSDQNYQNHNNHNNNYNNNNNNHNNNHNNNNHNNHNHNPHHKKAKYHPGRNQTTLETIVDYVFALPSLNHIVIELRAGRKSSRGFTSFMTQEDFDAIHHFIKKSAKTSPPFSEYIYERGKYLHSRLTANATGMVTSGVYKEKLASFDMETNHSHDIRIDVMKESPIVPIPLCPEEGYVYERKKLKYTIETKDWLVDLLEVTTNTFALDGEPGTMTESSVSYELEAQIKIASIRNVPDKKACVDLFENVFVEVHGLLARLTSAGAQVFPDLKLEKITRSDHYQYLKSQFLQVVPNINNNHQRFPGSLPSGLERNKIKMLQHGDYWISEKSDGLRYLLFIIDRGTYLINRRMDFYHIHKFPLLVELFGAAGVTLLDGEMVRNIKTGKLMYLIFDILALNGQTNIGMYNLSERLAIVGKKVVPLFRESLKDRTRDYLSKLQFTLSGKVFRPKHLIKELACMIKTNAQGERLFVDDKRCHRNDGLIFTPSGPYLPYSSSHLMKWKYCDRLTIDFLFKFTDEGHVALVGTGGTVMEDWPDFDLVPEDWAKLTSALAKTKTPSQAVIECAFDNEKDKWRLLTLRPDKDRPNHITTVQHTLFIVKENITLEELVYRIPIETDEDDWEESHPEIFSSSASSADSTSQTVPRSSSSPNADASDESPPVDLPSTPLPSPIVCKNTPPSDELFHSP